MPPDPSLRGLFCACSKTAPLLSLFRPLFLDLGASSGPFLGPGFFLPFCGPLGLFPAFSGPRASSGLFLALDLFPTFSARPFLGFCFFWAWGLFLVLSVFLASFFNFFWASALVPHIGRTNSCPRGFWALHISIPLLFCIFDKIPNLNLLRPPYCGLLALIYLNVLVVVLLQFTKTFLRALRLSFSDESAKLLWNRLLYILPALAHLGELGGASKMCRNEF